MTKCPDEQARLAKVMPAQNTKPFHHPVFRRCKTQQATLQTLQSLALNPLKLPDLCCHRHPALDLTLSWPLDLVNIVTDPALSSGIDLVVKTLPATDVAIQEPVLARTLFITAINPEVGRLVETFPVTDAMTQELVPAHAPHTTAINSQIGRVLETHLDTAPHGTGLDLEIQPILKAPHGVRTTAQDLIPAFAPHDALLSQQKQVQCNARLFTKNLLSKLKALQRKPTFPTEALLHAIEEHWLNAVTHTEVTHIEVIHIEVIHIEATHIEALLPVDKELSLSAGSRTKIQQLEHEFLRYHLPKSVEKILNLLSHKAAVRKMLGALLFPITPRVMALKLVTFLNPIHLIPS